MDNNYFPDENNALPKQPLNEDSPAGAAPDTSVAAAPVMSFNDSTPVGNYKKPRLIIAIISIVIFLAFVISGSVLLGHDERNSYYDDYGGSVSYSSTVYTGSNYVYAYSYEWTAYRFVPSYSGYYEFYTTGSTDTVGKLCSSSDSQLAYDDDSGDGYNFHIEKYLYAGSTYYIYVKRSSGSGSISLYIR